MKTILKLAAAALVANATWHVGSVYASHYRFRDAVESAAQFGSQQSEAMLEGRVVQLAHEYDIPISHDDFTVRRDGDHTIIDGSYSRPVDLFPGYSYEWPFT